MIKLLGKILIYILSFLLIILLSIPILLLPFVTSTPIWLWLILLFGELCLLSCLIHYLKIKRILLVISGLLLLNVFAVIISQLTASTQPILGPDGKPLPGSIAVLEKVHLNGSDQWITIRGKNVKNPVLLYLGIGGPGAGGFPATLTSLKPLEDHFTIINWDQPGTGKSYNAVPINTLTTQRFVDDAYALTKIIRTRFKQDKIYVMGLSWGTIVGIDLVKQHPEVIKAYIGNGQMVNTTENDRYGYYLALKISKDKKDTKTADKLKEYGPPPYEGNGLALKYAEYNDVLFEYMDSPTIPVIMLLVPQLAREYGYIDKINFDRGLYESFTVLYPQLIDLDFIKQAPKLNAPIYFLAGKKDVNAVSSIVERYYNALEAPYKKFVWLRSGHGATAEELSDILVNTVLAETKAGSK